MHPTGREACKIRDRRLIAAAGWLGTAPGRLRSSRITAISSTVSLGPLNRSIRSSRPRPGPSSTPLWHENFLIPIVRFGNPGVAALVSRHADGELA